MEYLNTIKNYPKELFLKSFREKNDKTKELFEKFEEYINKPMVKCCVVGNLSSGKSTLINALLERDILYEGIPEGTSCAAKCQSSPNNEEYFIFHQRNNYLNKRFPIEQVKDINFTNTYYATYSMDTSNYLDIFLNNPNNNILKKLLLIDCPGFNDNNLDAIAKYCKYADIIIFGFTAKAGITDNDIGRISRIKNDIKKFQIIIIINRCDECDSIDRYGIINKLSPILKGEDAIFFISALGEKQKRWNDANHREFNKFKECLQRKRIASKNTYNKVYLDLISSVNELLNCLNFGNFKEYQFGDKIFMDLQNQIIQLINNDNKEYYKNDGNLAMMDYSDKSNREISKFMMKQFIIDYKLNYEIIDDNYFYKKLIRNNDIPKPSYSWFNWGVKSEEMKKNFNYYFRCNSTTIQNEINNQYNEMAKSCLQKLQKYKNELQEITDCINSLVRNL